MIFRITKLNFIKNKHSHARIIGVLIIALLLLVVAMMPLLHFTAASSSKNLGFILVRRWHSLGSASIWTTDAYGNPKTDFSPGEIVFVHGEGFLINHNVDVDITRPDGTIESGSTMSDSTGDFVYEYDLNGIVGEYLVVASDGTFSAQTTFTDINVNAECQEHGYDFGIAKFQCGSTIPEEWGDCTGYDINVVWGPDCDSVSWTATPAVCGVLSKEATVTYDNPGGTSGTINKHGQQAISHITFCCCQEPETGCLEVTKVVDLGSVVNPGGVAETFEICISGPSYPLGDCKTIGIGGGTLSWSNLIPGDYIITESDPGAEWTVVGSPQTLSVAAGTSCATATITNTYNVGCLEIIKQVNWGSIIPDTDQTFTVTVTGPSYPSPGVSYPFDYDGGTWMLSDLIPGDYIITETDPGAPWLVSGSPQTVTVTAGTSCATATITNTYESGCLEVAKAVDWGGVSPDLSQSFTVSVVGPSYPLGESHTFGYDGGSWTLNDLIPGDYTITETDPGASWIVTPGLTQTVTVNPGTTCAPVSITNTIISGCLEINKEVFWGCVPPEPDQTFTVTVTGPSYPSPGVSHEFDYTGGSWSLNDLIPGEYTIVESDPGTDWVVTPGLTQTATVDPGTSCTSVLINNTICFGCLEVTVIVDWDGIPPDPTQTFTVTVTGPLNLGPYSDYTHVFGYMGGTWTINDLMPGDYLVEQADPGSNWVVTGGSQIVNLDSTCYHSVIVTNQIGTGCLEVSKVVDWGGVSPDLGQSFTVTVTGPSYPLGESHTFGYDGGSWMLSDLIPGDYTVTETDPGAPWLVSGSPQTVTVAAGTSCAAATITNTYESGCLEVTKVVDLGSVVNPSAVVETFEICISGPSYPSGDCKTIGIGGGTLSWSGLIPGDYTISESDPGAEWTVVGSPQTVSVAPGSSCATATVTNTYETGCLEVSKIVDWGGVSPDLGQSFMVSVVGPSYPSGASHTFGSSGGTWLLDDLIPGDYTITESDPGASWIVTGVPATITVNPGQACSTITITNTCCKPCITIVKEVWDENTGNWEEIIRVPIGTDLLFRITVSNCGSIDLHNIVVTDEMSSQLEYRDQSNYTPVDFSLHHVVWTFDQIQPGESIEITYHAETVRLCFGWNKATVVCDEGASAESMIPVKVIEEGQPIIDITKEVWDEAFSAWTDVIERSLGSMLTFRLTINNSAASPLDVTVVDSLPDQLAFRDDASIPPDSISGRIITWNLGIMDPGESIVITYKVEVVQEGWGDNVAAASTPEGYHDEDSVLVIGIDFALVQLITPVGSEHLVGTTDVTWFAVDSHDPNLEIYLYYSANNGNTWRRLHDDPLFNNIDEMHGAYEWDTTLLSDGEYMIKVEAVNHYEAIATDTSKLFYISNGYGGLKITDVRITDRSTGSSKWVKDGDTVEISAGITGAYGITSQDVYADLSGFNLGEHVVADSFDGFTAQWMLTGVTCTPSNGPIQVQVTTEDQSNTGFITADNVVPKVEIEKPASGLYLFNKRVLPLTETIVIGPLTVELTASDQGKIAQVECYIDDELQTTLQDEPFDWYMNLDFSGSHTLRIVAHDSAGNSKEISQEMIIFNPFGRQTTRTQVRTAQVKTVSSMNLKK